MPTEIPRRLQHLAAPLDEISPSDLQSVLLAVYQRRAGTLREAHLVARYTAPLCVPSSVGARLLHLFDAAAFRTASQFEALELAPVCPLGTSQVLGGIDQNSLLTTIRNAEVPGDSTPMLALEAARRRGPTGRTPEPIRLCASQRVVRLQPFDTPGFTPHFRLFALATAGRDTGSDAFELQHLTEHLRFYLELFRALNTEGFHAGSPLVEIGDLSITETLLGRAGVTRADLRPIVRGHRPGAGERFLAERGIALPAEPSDLAQPQSTRVRKIKERVFAPLAAAFPEAEFRIDVSRLEGLGYYTGLCLRVSPETADGQRYPVADGGFTGWTARLLQDRKERLLTSGIGSEFVCKRYLAS